MVLPIASVCSTRPPVSVLVRARPRLPRGFSREHGMTGFASKASSRVSGSRCADFHAHPPTRVHGDVQNPARLPFSVAPSVNSGAGAALEYLPAAHRLRLSASP